MYSNRGTNEVKTTLLGQLERKYGPCVADAGSGEIKCPNGEKIEIDKAKLIESSKFIWQPYKTHIGQVKAFLVKNGISKMVATGAWREMTAEEILDQRKNKFLKIGRGGGFSSQSDESSGLSLKENHMSIIFKKFLNNKKIIIGSIITIIGIITLIYSL